jgi:hypothetical protein
MGIKPMDIEKGILETADWLIKKGYVKPNNRQ